MSHTVELIPDPELGGFTVRLPDIPAYGEGHSEKKQSLIFGKRFVVMSRLLVSTMH